MKVIKLCLLFILLTLSVGLTPQKNEDISLSKEDLIEIFPDNNFRNVIYTYFPNEEITLSKLKSLDGEFYASGEGIKDLKGISMLENIDSFIFWDNNIKILPKEILKLHNIKYINLKNNYLTEDNTVNSLEEKRVEVDKNLNFIQSEDSQYQLCSTKEKVYLNEDEKLNLRGVLYKYIDNYENYWEPSKDLSKSCYLYIQTSNPSVTKINNNRYISFSKKGTYYISVSLDKNKYKSSTVSIKTIVR